MGTQQPPYRESLVSTTVREAFTLICAHGKQITWHPNETTENLIARCGDSIERACVVYGLVERFLATDPEARRKLFGSGLETHPVMLGHLVDVVLAEHEAGRL